MRNARPWYQIVPVLGCMTALTTLTANCHHLQVGANPNRVTPLLLSCRKQLCVEQTVQVFYMNQDPAQCYLAGRCQQPAGKGGATHAALSQNATWRSVARCQMCSITLDGCANYCRIAYKSETLPTKSNSAGDSSNKGSAADDAVSCEHAFVTPVEPRWPDDSSLQNAVTA
jgi:hypothetical protein